jgi:hypothetical protein
MNFIMGFLILAFTGVTETNKVAEPLSTPQSIMAALATGNGKAVVYELWTSGSWEKHASPGIKAADAKWLDVAEHLQPYTDAGASEDLADALAEALLKAPYRVLPILKRLWWANGEHACSFGYDSELPDGVAAYVNRLEKALKVMPPSSLASLRRECMAGIRETRANLKNNKN